MPTVLQFRRGTTAQNNAFTGSAGEVSIDTDLDTFRIHDGSTAGGSAAAAAMPSTAAAGATKFDWRVSISRSLSSCNWMCLSSSAVSLCGGRFVLGVYSVS